MDAKYNCNNCRRFVDQLKYRLSDLSLYYGDAFDSDWDLCSIDCLIEWAWKVRESQPKLSKSKQD